MRKKVIFLSAFSVILWGCNNSSAVNHEEAHVHEMHDHEEQNVETIELNNGRKWKVNTEMTPFILKGKELVEKYIADKGSDYTKLANEIEAQNNQLISSCSMDGKSHDELHKWLHPHLELVESLKNAKNNEAKELVAKIKTSYDEFGNYFE
jgi:uncharacterized lipoprotein NlpE involved in copper resistance